MGEMAVHCSIPLLCQVRICLKLCGVSGVQSQYQHIHFLLIYSLVLAELMFQNGIHRNLIALDQVFCLCLQSYRVICSTKCSCGGCVIVIIHARISSCLIIKCVWCPCLFLFSPLPLLSSSFSWKYGSIRHIQQIQCQCHLLVG